MNFKEKLGNIIFLIGVILFVIPLILNFVNKDLDVLILDFVMAGGLVFEFIGLCLTYKGDKNKSHKEELSDEEKAIEKEKTDSLNNNVEEIVEASTKPLKEEKEEKKTPSKKKETTKKTGTKKSTTKKKTTTKKNTSKKTTTKKSTTKKGK